MRIEGGGHDLGFKGKAQSAPNGLLEDIFAGFDEMFL
jgi:hypothetical protein